MEKIIIENVKNGEVFCHPLLLLSGRIRFSKSDIVHVRNTNTHFEKSSWPVVNGAFKLIILLQPAENVVNVECSSHSINICITYVPMETDYFVRLVYIVCRDDSGHFQAPENEDSSVESACRRLRLGARMIQTLTAEKILEYLSDRRTFKLEEDNRGKVVCHVFTSNLTKCQVHSMNSEELWKHFAVELMESELNGGSKCKFLAFLSATEYQWPSDTWDWPTSHADILKYTKGYVALGGGGLALFGTGCLHTWAQNLNEVQQRFADTRKIDRSRLMDDSCNRGEHWACYSTGLGATLHELAHTFDLGHTKDGIMGLGFHDTFKVFTAFLGSSGCSCFTPSELKKRKPNHYKISLIHNIEWASANNNRKDITSSFEDISHRQKQTRPCCACRIGASWTRSCAILLYYHKWFNPSIINGNISSPPTIIGNKIISDVGIRVVEIRDLEGMLLTHQEYLEGDGERTAVLDLENGIAFETQAEIIIVAEDSEGNIVKKTICLR